MNPKKLVRPVKPVGFSYQNWPNRQSYDNAMAAYANTLAIFKMLGGK